MQVCCGGWLGAVSYTHLIAQNIKFAKDMITVKKMKEKAKQEAEKREQAQE